MRKNSDAKLRAVKKYEKKTYSRMSFVMRKENEEKFLFWVQKTNDSKNGFLNKAVKTYIRILELKENQKVNENNS